MSDNDTIFACPLHTPAFSRKYLDYDIPDFREVIRNALPITSTRGDDCVKIYVNDDATPVPTPAFLYSSLNAILNEGVIKFVCYDAVNLHKATLQFIGDNRKFVDTVWRLTDTHSLWDVGLLEQRLVWALEGRAIDFPMLSELLEQYAILDNGSASLVGLLLAQFNRLVAELPALKNDVVGSMIFAESQPESPNIDPPDRILARPFHYKERLHVFIHFVDGWAEYGPACVGLDVQGKIAAKYLSEQTCNLTNDAARLRNRKDEIWSQKIRKTKKLAGCYSDQGESSNDGTPLYSEEASEKLLKIWNPPLLKKGQNKFYSVSTNSPAFSTSSGNLR